MKLTLEQVQAAAAELLDLIPGGWNRDIYFDVSKLMEECGEVAECLNKSAKTKEDLGEELADILVVCFIIALKQGIDLDQAYINKQKKRIKKLVDRFHNGHYPSISEGESI